LSTRFFLLKLQTLPRTNVFGRAFTQTLLGSRSGLGSPRGNHDRQLQAASSQCLVIPTGFHLPFLEGFACGLLTLSFLLHSTSLKLGIDSATPARSPAGFGLHTGSVVATRLLFCMLASFEGLCVTLLVLLCHLVFPQMFELFNYIIESAFVNDKKSWYYK
jgi:hypothetical protein